MKITFRSATINETGEVTLIAATSDMGINQITATVTEEEFKSSYEIGGTAALRNLAVQKFIEELEKSLKESV